MLDLITGKYDVFQQEDGSFEIFHGDRQVGGADCWTRMLDFFRARVDDGSVPTSTLVGLHLGRGNYAEMSLGTMSELR